MAWALLVAVLPGLAVLGPRGHAGPPKGLALAVLGSRADGGRYQAAATGVGIAASRLSGTAVRVVTFDDAGTKAGLSAAIRRLRRAKPVGVIAVPSAELADAYWKATRSTRLPWFLLGGVGPDGTRNQGNVWHLGPSPATQAVQAADALLAPLAARRVGIVHEATPLGHELAQVFARSLSRYITLAGVLPWSADSDVEDARSLKEFEADWIYAAVSGRFAASFVRALEEAGTVRRCLFADGNRSESLHAIAPSVLEGSLFLDAPDPELQGRMGEDLIEAIESANAPVDATTVRAFEAARRLLDAATRDEGSAAAKVRAALEAGPRAPGAFGELVYEPHRGIRFFPFTYWRVRKDRLELWNDGFLPTPGCGPPIGFGRPPPAVVGTKRAHIGYVTYGEGETRTIEQDLLELGLSTGGKDEELDRIVRDEILGRAIRIAHQLFRREPDGSAIPGWSWGMTFTTAKPPDDMPRSRIWLAIVAGDHPAAGGQVIGSGMVAVYSTFLKRTMYIQRKLDPPLSADDRDLLDGTYRWGEDRGRNFRSNKIRCLMDGLSSAMGLTLTHEFGHLCGCGHDTEHPTSIMNVVAGAGASWEAAVWIPSHQRNVTTALGVEGM